MHRKKKTRKTNPSSSLPLSRDENALLETLLGDMEKIPLPHLREQIPSSRMAVAFVERLSLESARALEVLTAIGRSFQEKKVQKAIRRTLFRLKRKGVPVPGPEMESAPAFIVSRAAQEDPQAYVGPIDATGTRPIFIRIPQIPQGTDIGMGLIGDEGGILEFVFGRYSKKKAKELETVFFERIPSMVETSLAHAMTLLERAYSLKTGEPGLDYLRLRPWLLEHTSPLEKPAVYEFLSSEDVSKQPLTDSRIQSLLSHERMAGWMVAPEKMKPVMEEIIHAQQSPILISEVQKMERVHQIKEASIPKLFPDSLRTLLKQRLEETAYLFLKTGEDAHARLALGCALSLAEKDSLLKVNPFLKALVEKTLSLYLKESKTPGTPRPPSASPSRIILP